VGLRVLLTSCLASVAAGLAAARPSRSREPIRAAAGAEHLLMDLLAARPAPSLLLHTVVLVLTITVAGCSSGDPRAAEPGGAVVRPVASAAPEPTGRGPRGAAATSSPAAELRAGLTALLVERTYLVAALTAPGIGEARSARHQAALLDALDDTAVALADMLGATYSEARAPLLVALRGEDRAWAALAAADGHERGATAQRTLEQARLELAQVIRRVVPRLDVDEVARQWASQAAAVRAGAGVPYEQLGAAAAEARQTAHLLASGMAADRRLSGVDTPAARLRADLTGLLTEHAALATALGREEAAGNPGRVFAVRGRLDENARALADVLARPYPALQESFLTSWSDQLDRLARYAAVRATGASGTAEAAVLHGYSRELSRLLAEHVDGLPAQSSEVELERMLSSLTQVVDAAATGAPHAPLLARASSADVLPPAALLSAAVAEDLLLR
jgi:hypothetical protein